LLLINLPFFYLTSSSGIIGSSFDSILIIDINTLITSSITLNDSRNIVALQYDTPNSLIGIQIVEIQETQPDWFQYVIVYINLNNGEVTQKIFLPQDQTYVNYQWMTFDSINRYIYLLSGNENDPYGLSTLLFSIDLLTEKFTSVQPNNNKFTIAGITWDPVKSRLLSISPGLFGNTSWSLVEVNQNNGNVDALFPIAPSGQYISYYGGYVWGFDSVNRILRCVFYQQIDLENGIIAQINVDTGSVTFSSESSILSLIHNIVFIQ